jgi:hypothetical protein
MENGKWQRNRKTIPRKVKPLEKTSPNNNENTDDDDEEMVTSLIGLVLTQCLCLGQFVRSLDVIAPSNLATPKTGEAWLFVLSEMVILTMNSLDQLRTLTLSSKVLFPTSRSKKLVYEMDQEVTDFLAEIQLHYGV